MKWGEGASGNGFLALQRDTEFCHYLDKLSRTAVVNSGNKDKAHSQDSRVEGCWINHAEDDSKILVR